jgi:hypothetical protein
MLEIILPILKLILPYLLLLIVGTAGWKGFKKVLKELKEYADVIIVLHVSLQDDQLTDQEIDNILKELSEVNLPPFVKNAIIGFLKKKKKA